MHMFLCCLIISELGKYPLPLFLQSCHLIGNLSELDRILIYAARLIEQGIEFRFQLLQPSIDISQCHGRIRKLACLL